MTAHSVSAEDIFKLIDEVSEVVDMMKRFSQHLLRIHRTGWLGQDRRTILENIILDNFSSAHIEYNKESQVMHHAGVI